MFWASGFWASGFWAEGFWEGMVDAPETAPWIGTGSVFVRRIWGNSWCRGW